METRMSDEATAYHLEGSKKAYEAGEFLTDQQLATMLGVTTRTTLRWRREGSGPKYCRIGPRYIRYFRTDVLAWAAENTFATMAAEAVDGEGRAA
jgi:predicted DNA-binding transcriptional regulator AlpA